MKTGIQESDCPHAKTWDLWQTNVFFSLQERTDAGADNPQGANLRFHHESCIIQGPHGHWV